jgi:hypothetical protein
LSRDTDPCYPGVRSPNGLLRQGVVRSASMERDAANGLTEVPLPSPKHLQHSSDECSDVDIGSMFGDVKHPYEPD